MSINIGDEVLIKSGPLAGRRAVVVDLRDDVAHVMINVFDRTVPLDVVIDSLEPPDDDPSGERAT